MEGGMFTGIGNGTQLETKVVQTFQKSFVQVQDILDQNRLLSNEINQNHELMIPNNLSWNVGLIRELNNNIKRVVDLYADLSGSFSMSMEASSEAESGGTLKSNWKSSEQRIRSRLSSRHLIWFLSFLDGFHNHFLIYYLFVVGNFRLPALFFSHVCQKNISCGVPSLVKDNNGGLVYTVSKLSMFREVSCVKFLELVYIADQNSNSTKTPCGSISPKHVLETAIISSKFVISFSNNIFKYKVVPSKLKCFGIFFFLNSYLFEI
ncbi:hypothetical protein DVH24_000434 [Malus domestica]|uniref:Protein EARLY FLOWERING 4 domain-containing protein n=2 Tax=Malus TaxID=3749 RepID=A0A498J298_MALDO|nr:hypothetical protein DVH24_000434 [Malus domestica]